ncbi:MAG: hypothetical protein H6549_06055 [Chitinophagales bacterium]|nr:hypothetical protein [Chitinophagales bacterium]
MTAMIRYLILVIFLLPFFPLFGQGLSVTDTLVVPLEFKPEFRRQLNHDHINAAQAAILASDGKKDKEFTPTKTTEINTLVTRTVTRKVDNMQYMIETDTVFDHRLKVLYLSGLENLLSYFAVNWKEKGEKRINPLRLSQILEAYEEGVDADRQGKTIEFIVKKLPFDAGTVLLQAGIFNKNPGYKNSQDELVLKYCLLHPSETFATLSRNPGVPFADSLIRIVAVKYPRQLYDYAAANNRLAVIIQGIRNNVFIESVAKMAKSRSGQQYFPFLDNIVKGKMTLEEIDAVKDDSLQYYKLLVKTQMEYVRRTLDKDTAMEFRSLTERLEKKAREDFVNIINGLHNENAEVRFRCIQPLSAEELYYLAVSSDGSIYTSSFVKGVYPLMMKRINYKSDSLLTQISFDKYRKFIKMAAGYNTLSDFLGNFPPAEPGQESDAAILMKAFVGRLEIGDGLEDGVDVADSYASIAETIQPLAQEMIKNVKHNYLRNQATGNKRGMAIYKILLDLFLSADSTSNIDLTKELGIPPVYDVPYKSMIDSEGRVVMQVFFYGDSDGQGIFRGFVGMFSNSNWKIDGSNKQWVTITSAKGRPVIIFANRALPEETGEDEQAQQALCKYMEVNKYYPTVTIHRGHSYYAESTIEQMFSSSKIVFLGSCGGYHLIHDVLEKASDAHIIASKQIGATEVNKPFFKLLTDKAQNGEDINWIPFWKELDKMITAKEFEDYIPPYKNLGALFIKAYKIAMGENNTDDEEKAGF